MALVAVLFWASALVTVYPYFIYPVVLWVLSHAACVGTASSGSRLAAPPGARAGSPCHLQGTLLPRALDVAAGLAEAEYPHRLPGVGQAAAPTLRFTIITPAFDEERFVVRKLENCASLDYPPEKVQVLLVSDGSTDSTVSRAQEWLAARAGNAKSSPRFELLVLPERVGKMAAILAAMAHTEGEVIVFSDVTAVYDPGVLRAFARRFADEAVGGVSGTLRLVGGGDDALKAGEGAYWRYETMLRRLESRIGSTVIAPGSIYAVRKELFVSPPPDTIADDFAVTLGVLEQGYRMVFEEGASATERISITLAEEFSRKVRIVAGGIQTLMRYRRLMAPSRGLVALELVSHKLLRWLVPYAMVLALATALVLWARGGAALYVAASITQLCFYGASLLGYAVEAGWLRANRARPKRVLAVCSLAFHFTAINVAAMLGWYRQLTGTQPVAWRKTAK